MTAAPVVLRAQALEVAGAGARRAIDLVCERGSITVITGPSAWATTRWLEALAGLRPAAGGTVRVDGVAAGEAPGRTFGYVDSNAPLLSSLSVRANVMLPAMHHHGESRDKARRFADRLLDRVGFEGPRTEPPARLSPVGNAQALLARALALDPPLVFIDEPFEMQTIASWKRLADCLGMLAGDDNRIVLVATRNLAFAADRADRLVYIGDNDTRVYDGWPAFSSAEETAAFIATLPFTQRNAA